jgi:tetratricopeptide (TPR) repeat protein
VKALRRLAAKLGVNADYLETGSELDAESARELKLSDLELAIRLGEAAGAEAGLQAVAADAAAAGDRQSDLRAHVALAALAHERGDYAGATKLLEAALADEAFDPVGHAEIYSQLARAYTFSGRSHQAVELFERCLAEVAEGDDAALEARYATALSYALTDIGDLPRAEAVVRHAIERTSHVEDPYMRVRLYWSMARLAHNEGRSGSALENVRKAIALLHLTDDTLHLARANLLAASISLSRDDADRAETYLDQAEQQLGSSPSTADLFELRLRRCRIATLRGQAEQAVELARSAVDLAGNDPVDEGLALSSLAEALAMTGDPAGADDCFRRAVSLLEANSRWRDAATTCRAWARMLRQVGREQQALDVLDRAAELGMRGSPADARVER